MKHSLALFLITLLVTNLMALDIYVSPRGNDNNSGSKEQPLASIFGARNHLRTIRKEKGLTEDVRILFMPGRYFLTKSFILEPKDSGNNKFKISYMAAEKEKPEFIGGTIINKWKLKDNGLWQATIEGVVDGNYYFEQLYSHNGRLQRARTPNSSFYPVKGVSEHPFVGRRTERVDKFAVQNIRVTKDAIEKINEFSANDKSDAIVIFYHKWDNTRKRISYVDTTTSSFYIVGTGMKPWNQINTKSRYYIENFRNALDTCGEWYLDRSGDLLYMPKPEDDINNFEVIAPITTKFVEIRGTKESPIKNILFQDLVFKASKYNTPISGNESEQAAASIEAVIMADYLEHSVIKNCEIIGTGTSGIWLKKGCKNSTIEHCYLNDLGAGGIKIGEIVIPEDLTDLTSHITIDNNIVSSGGLVFPCAVGMTLFQTSDNKVTHNEIADFRYSGMSIGWTWGYSFSPSKRNTVAYNHIHHIGWGVLSDMGAVYCLGKSEGTRIRNNVIHHIFSYGYGGWGLYTDEGSTGITMVNNLVYACKSSGFHQHYGKENVIKNNIFGYNLMYQLQATRVEEHLSFSFSNNIIIYNTEKLIGNSWHAVKLDADYNCYWNTAKKPIVFAKQNMEEWQKSGKDSHSIIADPMFVDAENFNFKFKKKKTYSKIEFKPFDFTKAGVYGSKVWIERGKLDLNIIKKFDDTVTEMWGKTNW